MTDDERLPVWAARARTVARGGVGLYVLLWLISGIVWLVDGFVVDLPAPTGLETARVVGVLTVVATVAAAGLVWLAGEAVAGYRTPKE